MKTTFTKKIKTEFTEFREKEKTRLEYVKNFQNENQSIGEEGEIKFCF